MLGLMTTKTPLVAVLQAGRLEYEALLLAASFAMSGTDGFQLTFLEPQPGPLWPGDPTAHVETRAALRDHGAEIMPFDSKIFGAAYPHGNKIEALGILGAEPFVFVDTDTLVLCPLDKVPFTFDRPSASLRREGTWPKGDLARVWTGLYDAFGVDIAPTLDTAFPPDDWRRYLYFNAGYIYGANATAFHRRWSQIAGQVWRAPPSALAGQSLEPWLDQATLPLVIAEAGGGRDTGVADLMDGVVTCHYRHLPLLFARESDAAVEAALRIAEGALKPLLKRYPPFAEVLYKTGPRIRERYVSQSFATEADLRKVLKSDGFWTR